ncbi:cdbc631f-05f2-4d6f-8123-454a19292c32 [Sclerotinia trifoliorum]|uniref:Cdbc631f-05f2-4d6f-8123-454a19292c32 n=1 Tax=Sclerotinia trifoliorum TaxID=28548 RepID=A0A8H2VSH4_9HELO|nr:cdbc631f-05f2-4d6f-8123-454a19292c32 [Sclerotinia trifoliorum]
MTRVLNLSKLFCAFVLAAQIHAANVPPPWRPDPGLWSPIHPPPIPDPVPTTCSTSTVSIECKNNACQSAWATAFTSSNVYVQSFCSSFTSLGRQNTNKFDRGGPATGCTRGLNNAAIQSSISSVCSCYAGPGVPTQAFITICPSCPPIQTQIQAQTITTSIPTTITKTASQSTKTITTIITLIIDPPPPSHITTTTTEKTTLTNPSFKFGLCTTTTNINLVTTTQVTAIYDYFTWTTILTTTYQAGRYPCATTICTCPTPTPTISTITYTPENCNDVNPSQTSTITNDLSFFPSPAFATLTCDSITTTTTTTTTTITLVIDPLPIEYTITETVTAEGSGVCTTTTTTTATATKTESESETTTWDDDGFWPLQTLSPLIDLSLTLTDESATPTQTFSQILIDVGG